MAKADTGPNKAELKKWLNRADSKPVNMAFALDKEGKVVLKLDGMKQSRALEKGIKDAHPDVKNSRFGIVRVDPDAPDTAKFIVNKAVGGVARKLAIALKGTGFRKVQILLEDGSALDSAEHDDEEEAEPGASSTAPHADPNIDAEVTGATAEPAAPTPPAAPNQPAAPGQPAADPTVLTATLTALVKHALPVLAADQARRDQAKTIIGQAQAALKSNDLATAGRQIESLRALLDQDSAPQANPAAPNPAAGPAPGPAVAAPAVIAKAKQAWVATRQKVEKDLGNLHGAFTSAFKGHGQEADLTKAFKTRVDTVLQTLDEELAHTLDAVNDASDHSERSKRVQEAHAIIAKFRGHVASDPTIAALDSNPFVPLSIQKTMTATLAALSKSIH